MQESTIIRRSGRTILTVLALTAGAVVVAPAAQADDWKSEQATQVSRVSDASDRSRETKVAGIPRAMPSDYARAGVELNQPVAGMPRTMPVDYARAGISPTDLEPVSVRFVGRDHVERIVGDSPFAVSGHEIDTGIEWAPLALGMAIGLGLSALLGLSLLSRRRKTFAHA
jgi:hypothetical protein